MANPEISKVIGEQWRQLSEEEKSKWKALAEVSTLLTPLIVSIHRSKFHYRKRKSAMPSSILHIATNHDESAGMAPLATRPRESVTIPLVVQPAIDAGAAS